ncbi:hypothetical protein [Aquibacillus albus]|uniref:Uncharacterized protein YycO n=1 Tax=Aquibacillus albus TaxID=1168171 RepID=A0ABS2MXT3_9BACI|nr:hypothetical protein [Aquibacillus albus]MBM7570694.1 uncharacterized protein YycO [Aquibacillus albus]
MSTYFKVIQSGKWLKIKNKSNLPCLYYCVYIDYQLVAIYYYGDTFYLPVDPHVDHHILVTGMPNHYRYPAPIAEQFIFTADTQAYRRDYKPGDILVASDNVNEAFTGYMGHSALVVDENHVIESPGGYPAIRKDSIQQFLDKHPQHAHFRPKSKEIGQKAVAYAEEYLKEYEKNIENGEKTPTFSFNLTQSLKDPWEYIYCSKLVWLSYYHGADYELENDHLWFSPEDLYTKLKDNDDFELIYEHEEVNFQLDT